MKKVGIITVHSAYNYGAVLQAYALQEYLKIMGYDSYIINYRNKIIDDDYKFLRRDKNLKQYLKNFFKLISLYKFNYYIRRTKNYENFFKNYYRLIGNYKDENELKLNYPKLDYYIAGSDQIWNPEITNNLSDIYTLNFGDSSIKKISYAASTGINYIPENLKKEFSKKLKIIDNISIREPDNKEILEYLTNKEISVVVDPTLLHDCTFWENVVEKKSPVKDKYIFCYIVGGNNDLCVDYVNKISKEKKLGVIHCDKKKVFKNELNNIFSHDPFSFLNYIKHSEYVITTSFHAVVFSIIFRKKFIAIQNLKNNSRVLNLLRKLKINNRIILKRDDFNFVNIDDDIDYNVAHNLLKTEIKESKEFLKGALDYEK